ncbi:MAG: hypothetical protein JF617_03340 [Burkholderiales bacterium]|jgi:hypothetical protein|nr:hypothetical protein [Burkholderiales bacterium]
MPTTQAELSALVKRRWERHANWLKPQAICNGKQPATITAAGAFSVRAQQRNRALTRDPSDVSTLDRDGDHT